MTRYFIKKKNEKRKEKKDKKKTLTRINISSLLPSQLSASYMVQPSFHTILEHIWYSFPDSCLNSSRLD